MHIFGDAMFGTTVAGLILSVNQITGIFISGKTKYMKYLTFVIKAVRDFVANHDTNATVIQRLWEMLAVEKWLQNASRENWNKAHSFS
jgi:hypothetical protein